jgi:TonB family protein
MKRAFGLLLLLAMSSAADPTAADASGKWMGSMTASSGAPVPVFLTLREQGKGLSGSIAFATEASQAPIEKVRLRGDRLTFNAPDPANHIVAFHLTVKVRSMNGEAITEGQTLKVGLLPATLPGVYHVGGDVSAPKVLYRVEPEYTVNARKAKLQGSVVVYALISPEGRVINMKVSHRLGLGLDEKAMEALTKWRFQPGMKDGQPVTVEALIDLHFSLLLGPPR